MANAQLCPGCGEPDTGLALCRRCGASLLVDVRVLKLVTDEKARFAAARAVAALGPPAPAFGPAREALATPRGLLCVRVSRAFAGTLQSALHGLGVAVDVVPHAQAELSARPVRSPVRAVVTAGAAVLVAVAAAGAVVAVANGRRASHSPAPDGRVVAAAATPSNAPVPAAAAEGKGATADDPADRLELVGKKVLPSVVSMRCGNKIGAGFFVEPELVVTNAHVACDNGDPMEVTLHDGRTLLGLVATRDERFDVARVRVVGANAAPLSAGDTTALSNGEWAAIAGSPRGMSFTLNEAHVSFVGRPLLGVNYVQFNGSVNPGNSGGPLVDKRGRVVGIVTLKVLDAEGIGLALPIEYALKPDEGSAHAQAWQKLLGDVEKRDAEAADEVRFDSAHPTFIDVVRLDKAVQHAPQLVVALYVERTTVAAHATVHELSLRYGGAEICRVKGVVEEWVPFSDLKISLDTPQVKWLVRHKLTDDVYFGGAALEGRNCAGVSLLESARLVDLSGDQWNEEHAVDHDELEVLDTVLRDKPDELLRGIASRVRSHVSDIERRRAMVRTDPESPERQQKLRALDAETLRADGALKSLETIALRRGYRWP